MTHRGVASVALVLAAAVAVACGADRALPSLTPFTAPLTAAPTIRPIPSAPSAPSSTPLATIPIAVTATMTERCGSIGGCAAYLIVRATDGEVWGPISLLGRADPSLPAPTALAPGAYTFLFSWRARSDSIERGQPPAESILDTCAVDVMASTIGRDVPAIEVTATFHGATCEAAATYTVTIVD